MAKASSQITDSHREAWALECLPELVKAAPAGYSRHFLRKCAQGAWTGNEAEAILMALPAVVDRMLGTEIARIQKGGRKS